MADDDMDNDENESWSNDEMDSTDMNNTSEPENMSGSMQNNNEEKLININNATKDELMTVPGINERMAQAIIKYRDKIGRFDSLDQISNVKELKKEHIQTLKKWVAV